jgi:hypothetical protein
MASPLRRNCLKRETVLAATAILTAFAIAMTWWFRWDVHVVNTAGGPVSAYVVDRWTGTLYWARGQGMVPVSKSNGAL